ncbi:NAD(P)/FAD-dependent oxidoreductase [Methylobacterium platani]|uniref:FAD-dependent oxidoreductase n=2 Tax=Methylobacterium platani TaxID=427683 RepID=A0A179SM63_9HYPH|nr:FAD-binding oxidoreductase [Methylobacterium platani]KMO15684.1 FAD-dependent oxidoreductase [Methylobacterium platani JCM 14648]OAS27543.1 FAD-dependent oxidoreductase [Methylobacterium platani]
MTTDPRSHGLWARTAPPAPDAPPLRSDATVDVAVVGAGYTGLSAALHLAKAGARVAVLEGETVGFGGSGRNVGLVNAGLWVKPDLVPAALGPERGERLLSLLGTAPRRVFDLIAEHAIACEAQDTGTLHCAVGAKGLSDLADRARQWQARGAPVRLLDAAETARATGARAYAGALLDERAGTIQPLAYARGLARAALAAGAAIHAGSPVLGVAEAGTRWRLTTPGGRVDADWVVVATNAYTRAPWPEIRAEIAHLPYFNIATAPLSDNLRGTILPGRQGAWDTKPVLTSFRLDAAGRLVLGSVGALRGTGAAVHRAWARRTLKALFPQAGDVPFEAEWYGRIGMTADALPRFHRLARNVVGFSGYNGRGIAPGTAFGGVLADLVAGRITEDALPLPVTAPVPIGFRAVRELAYEAGAQAVHLAEARFPGRAVP